MTRSRFRPYSRKSRHHRRRGAKTRTRDWRERPEDDRRKNSRRTTRERAILFASE